MNKRYNNAEKKAKKKDIIRGKGLANINLILYGFWGRESVPLNITKYVGYFLYNKKIFV